MWNRRRTATRGLTSSELVITDSRRLVRLLGTMLALALIALVTSLSLFLSAEIEPPDTPASAESESASALLSGPGESSVADASGRALAEQNVQLQAQISALQDALNGATLDLEVERATRAELELQLNGLREHLVQTQEELAFLKSAGAGVTKP